MEELDKPLDDTVLNDWLNGEDNGMPMMPPVFREKEEPKMVLRYPVPELPKGHTGAERDRRDKTRYFEKMQTVVVPQAGEPPLPPVESTGPRVFRHVVPPPPIDRALSDALQAMELSAGGGDAAGHRHLRSPHLPSEDSPDFLSSDTDSDSDLSPSPGIGSTRAAALDQALGRRAGSSSSAAVGATGVPGGAGGGGGAAGVRSRGVLATPGTVATTVPAKGGAGELASVSPPRSGTAGSSTGYAAPAWAPTTALDVLESAGRVCASPAELACLLDAANRFVFLEPKVGTGDARAREVALAAGGGTGGTGGGTGVIGGVLGDVVQTLAYVAEGTLEDERLERIAMEQVPAQAGAAACWRLGAGAFWLERAVVAARQELTAGVRAAGWGALTEEAVPECVATVLGEVRGALGAAAARLPLAAVEVVDEPRLVAGNRDDWVEVAAGWPALWDALQLAPYAQRKDVQCYVLCPDNQADDVRPFFLDLCVAYAELCHLGRHTLGTDFPGAPDGIVHVPSGLTVDTSRDATNENHLRQYVGKAAALGKHIAEAGARDLRADSCVVVYVVDPFTRARDVDSFADVVRSMAELLRHTRACVCPGARAPVVVEPVPIARAIAYRPDTRTALRDLALRVYAKIRRGTFGQQPNPLTAELPRLSPPPFLAYEPPYVVSCIPEPPQTHTQSFPVHICYDYSPDRAWIVSTLTDSVGELLQTFVVPNTPVPPVAVASAVRARTTATTSSSAGVSGAGATPTSTGGPARNSSSDNSGDGTTDGSSNSSTNGNGNNSSDNNSSTGSNSSSSNSGNKGIGEPGGADANTSGDSVEMLDVPGDEDSTSGATAAAAAAAAPFEACFEQWMGFLHTVDRSKGWMLAITALGVMTGAEYRAWDRVITRHFEGAPKPRLVTLLALRLAPQWQLLDPAAAGPSLRRADSCCDAVTTRTVMAVPETSPMYDLDMSGVTPEAVAIVSSPAPHAVREARWPVAYTVALLHQYSESRTKVVAPRVTVQVLARQINALSWLNVLPSAPARASVLPRHALITRHLATLCTLLPPVLHSIATSDATAAAAAASAAVSAVTSPPPVPDTSVSPPPPSTPSRF